MLRQSQNLPMTITAGARMAELCGELPTRPAKLICAGMEGRTHTGRGTGVPEHPVQPPASSDVCWGCRGWKERDTSPHQKLPADCTLENVQLELMKKKKKAGTGQRGFLKDGYDQTLHASPCSFPIPRKSKFCKDT